MACLLVGVLNVTPDSFSDGGKYAGVEAAVAAGARMADAGANWKPLSGTGLASNLFLGSSIRLDNSIVAGPA